VSTRLLIYAAILIHEGVPTDRACDVAIARPITDDPDMQRSILELVKAIF
jgi:nitric oxide reductase NorQ protein